MSSSDEGASEFRILFIEDGVVPLDSGLELIGIDRFRAVPESSDSGVDGAEEMGVEVIFALSLGYKVCKV